MLKDIKTLEVNALWKKEGDREGWSEIINDAKSPGAVTPKKKKKNLTYRASL